MSFKRNVVANYVGQFYVTIVNIVAVPLYLKYMGAEAYGLVGFYSLMQSWFQILDLGLSPTLAREMARFKGGALNALGVLRLLRAVESLFYLIAMVGAGLLILCADLLAKHWLNAETLPSSEVARIVRLMGLVVALRWASGLYRSAIGGLEEQVWLNAFNIAMASARSLLVIPFLALVEPSLWMFFGFQFVVSLVETFGLALKSHSLMPTANQKIGWSFEPLRGLFKFSITIAFTAFVWVLVTQTDKLVLSKFLKLSDFGTFTLGVLVAGTVNLAGGPISQALLPRLARLAAAGDESGLIALYRRATQWVSAVAAPASLVLAVFAEPVLWVWTGNREAAHRAAPILTLYAIGNGLLSVAAFQYYLQYAKGSLRLHLLGNIAFVIILVPLLVWAASTYGSLGAGRVWVSQCATYLFLWTWVVHSKHAPGIHWRWLLKDVFPVWGLVALAALAESLLRPHIVNGSRGRLGTGVLLVLCGLGLACVGGIATSDGRSILGRILRRGRLT